MDKFKGEVRIININDITPNDWNPKESINDNAFNKEKYEEIKANIVKKGMYEPIKVATVNGKLTILDGFHRWTGCKELKYTKIIIWDLGTLSRAEAIGITTDSEFLKVPVSEVLVAKMIKDLTVQEITLEFLPFDKGKIEEYKQMATFDWQKPAPAEPEAQKQRTVTCPNCGEAFTL